MTTVAAAVRLRAHAGLAERQAEQAEAEQGEDHLPHRAAREQQRHEQGEHADAGRRQPAAPDHHRRRPTATPERDDHRDRHAIARGQERGSRGRRVVESVHLEEHPAAGEKPQTEALREFEAGQTTQGSPRNDRQHDAAHPEPEHQSQRGQKPGIRARQEVRLRERERFGQRKTQPPQARGAQQPTPRADPARRRYPGDMRRRDDRQNGGNGRLGHVKCSSSEPGGKMQNPKPVRRTPSGKSPLFRVPCSLPCPTVFHCH